MPSGRKPAGGNPGDKSSSTRPARRTAKRRQTVTDVIKFWFVEHGQKDWFAGSRKFDAEIKSRFSETRERAKRGELANWRKTPEGRLAEIIVLDQFSRQLFRGKPEAFAADPIALVLAQEAVAAGADQQLAAQRRWLFYMPFLHSESLVVHRQGSKLFRAVGGKEVPKFAKAHRDLIKKFGRYPMRNQALGRKSTRAEIAYMAKRGGRMF